MKKSTERIAAVLMGSVVGLALACVAVLASLSTALYMDEHANRAVTVRGFRRRRPVSCIRVRQSLSIKAMAPFFHRAPSRCRVPPSLRAYWKSAAVNCPPRSVTR